MYQLGIIWKKVISFYTRSSFYCYDRTILLSYFAAMKKYIAECFGTAVLVLVGCGAAVVSGDALGLLGVALAFGFAVMTMVYTIGNISGCHINPAISLAMWMRGKLSTNDLAGYVAAQAVGALIGAFILLQLVWPSTLAANAIWDGYSASSVIMGEIVFTALFLMVIFGATAKKWAGDLAGVVIGLALTMGIMVMWPISNASFNPARSFGPALLGNGDAMSQFWMFVVWPVLGAVLAVALWKYVLCAEKKK